MQIKGWTFKDVNFDNAAQSLFWTGFSVPVLSAVKLGFDYSWTFGLDTPVRHELFVWMKFFTICVANGAYIAMHNTLRRFDNRVIRANFFRSVLAWPFAAVFEPVGNFLMVPSIVQAKFWSEVIAAVIEGVGKLSQRVVLRKRDYLEILPMLRSDKKDVRLTAMLDILFIWAKRQRGRTCLSQILTNRKETPAASFEYPELMLKLFDPQNAHYELSMFIVDRYPPNEAIVLTDFINAYLIVFDNWLKRLNKKNYGKPKPNR